MSQLDRLRSQARRLADHAHNVTSQHGEDGIIAKALDLLPERNGWCVEFGAWDGRQFSNTYALTQQGYRGVFIEADARKFRELERTHGAGGHVLINAAVGFDDADCLDALLSATQIPIDPDLLSIDIDGNDFHVWSAVQRYRPKLVIVEYNPTIANGVLFVQDRRASVTQGSSASSLVELARAKAYELIAVTVTNLVFVDRSFYPLFGIPDNSLILMRDEPLVSHIFVGFDGHIFLCHKNKTGGIPLLWHSSSYPRLAYLRESQAQVLRRSLQKYPDNYTAADRAILRFQDRLRRAFAALTLPSRSR